ncbi:MAG: glycosyltransferase family 2 protein [Lachnospiraceae bacterium]|nr:glycosyltransferase family 2 protein [Lachnospiraceae bacterium]
MKLPVTPYKIKKGILYWKHFGTKEFFSRLMDRLEKEDVPYDAWFRQHRAGKDVLERQRKDPLPGGPLISVIVPSYNPRERHFEELLESVRAQSYERFELIVADAAASHPAPADKKRGAAEKTVREMTEAISASDSRFRYVPLEDNYGIAENTNRGIEASRGSIIAFLDHDDLIEPDALYEIASATALGADMIYTDEDKITGDGQKYFQPHFKPSFNPDLLRSNNYITHFLAVKRDLIMRAGAFKNEMNGAQDYDFILRCSEKAEKIVRIPRILYHWRTHEASTADNPMSKMYAYEAGRRALQEHLGRCGEEGTVELLQDFGFYRIHYPLKGTPTVSVIIPNKDQQEALESCVRSLMGTGYPSLEIIIVENGSTEKKTFDYYRRISGTPGVKIVRWKDGFNYSAINNYGVRYATGDFLLFLNNDVRGDISPDWLTEMLGVIMRPGIGAVGARLYYPDGRIQSAGIVIGMGGVAGSMFVDLPRGRTGYMHKAAIMQDMSAVTAACMMMRKEVFLKAGGFEEKLAVAFNDVDLCLRVGEMGYRIVYDPFAELYHDESRSRGAEDTPEKVRRFQSEIEFMRTRWTELLKDGDPYYNPNMSLKKWNWSIRG